MILLVLRSFPFFPPYINGVDGNTTEFTSICTSSIEMEISPLLRLDIRGSFFPKVKFSANTSTTRTKPWKLNAFSANSDSLHWELEKIRAKHAEKPLLPKGHQTNFNKETTKEHSDAIS
jgi:hypothetical protein